MSTTTQDITLVVGGTGKTGRRVADQLRARGHAVRIGSRSGTPPFAWEAPATWRPALAGVRAAYVAYAPDLAVPGAPETVGAFARQAVAAGVERLVLLSGRGEAEAEAAEREVQAAGATWTVVRAAWFAQNFSESFFLEPLLHGELALPVDTVVEPFVDVDDIADVAVAALTEPGHDGRVYEVTGPEALTFRAVTERIARATGREIRFVPVPLDAYAAGMAASGAPDDLVALTSYLFSDVLDGRNAATADGVQQALGRTPRSFDDYVRRTAAAGAWSLPAAAPAAD